MLKAEEKRMMVLMMFEIKWIESGLRQHLYIHLDMAGGDASLVSISLFDWQVHDDLPSSSLGDIV